MLNKPPFRPLDYHIGKSLIRVEYTDITALAVDVMVSSDDIDLSMGGGVSEALLRAGGQAVWDEAQAQSPLRLGDIAITTAGRLSAKKIFHAAVLDYSRRDLTTVDLVRRVTRKCLVTCDELGFNSIAFPALGTGVARLSPERSAVAMTIETAMHLSGPTHLELVVMALFPREHLNPQILPRFYAQVSDFIETAAQVENLWAALSKLEAVYRELNMDSEAEETGRASREIRRRISEWEEVVLSREPDDREEEWSDHREGISQLLTSYTASDHARELEKLRQQRVRLRDEHTLEAEYKQYRAQALAEMIAIRKKNVSDLDLQLARRGFSVEINRQLEYEKAELKRLQEEQNLLKS